MVDYETDHHTIEIVTSWTVSLIATVSVKVPSTLILIVAIIEAAAVSSEIVIVLWSSTTKVVHIALVALVALYRIRALLLWTFIEASPNLRQ